MKVQAKCPICNADFSLDPAKILGKMRKTMSPAAVEQRRQAVLARWKKYREAKGDMSET